MVCEGTIDDQWTLRSYRLTAPVSVRCKLLLREMMTSLGHTEWDDPLADTYLQPWTKWVESLPKFEQCSIPRMYSDISFAKTLNNEVHILERSYWLSSLLETIRHEQCHSEFPSSKSKGSPVNGKTIPLLEMYTAVLAAELADMIKEHVGTNSYDMYF